MLSELKNMMIIMMIINFIRLKKIIHLLFLINIYVGDWGLGIGDWGLGIGPNPQSPIPYQN